MYFSAAQIRERVRVQDPDQCTDGRLCYAAPFPAQGGDGQDERRPYGVPLDEFVAQFPFVRDRVDVEMARCPGAIPEIIVWLLRDEKALPLPAAWRGYPVRQRGPVIAYPLSGLGAEGSEAPVTPSAQEAAFPVGPAIVVSVIALGAFVLSFFVHRSPAGRWYLQGIDRGPGVPLKQRIAEVLDWSEADVDSFSLPMLREMVRTKAPQLARELEDEIQSGRYIYGKHWRRSR